MERFRVTSRQPCWSPKITKRLPNWCPTILRELNSIFIQKSSFVSETNMVAFCVSESTLRTPIWRSQVWNFLARPPPPGNYVIESWDITSYYTCHVTNVWRGACPGGSSSGVMAFVILSLCWVFVTDLCWVHHDVVSLSLLIPPRARVQLQFRLNLVL